MLDTRWLCPLLIVGAVAYLAWMFWKIRHDRNREDRAARWPGNP